MRPLSITARLTLFFSAAAAAVLLAFGHVVGTLVAGHFEALDLDELNGKLELVRHALAKPEATAVPGTLRGELSDALVGQAGFSVVVARPGGDLLFALDHAGVGRSLIRTGAQTTASGRPPPRVVEHAGHVYRAIVAPVDGGAVDGQPVVVAVALDVSRHRNFLERFHVQLWGAIGAGVAIAALFGWLAARRGLAPLRDMARVARGVSAQRLGERLETESIPGELIELAAAFNGMLARLEDSFRRLSAFSSDLAHELRTPIGNLMMQTQVALSKARSADEYREVLYSNLEEHERLARTIADMLFLAHADHGLLVPRTERVDLANEVRELFAFYDALAEERRVGLSFSGDGVVHGDPLMIRRALSNLLSNAILYTPAEGTVRVSIGPEGDGAVRLTVENPGREIGPEHLPRLFDRFYRIDASRTKSDDGAGLGLAITKSIVEAHGGTIGVSSGSGSIRFEITLPGPTSPARRAAAAPRPARST